MPNRSNSVFNSGNREGQRDFFTASGASIFVGLWNSSGSDYSRWQLESTAVTATLASTTLARGWSDTGLRTITAWTSDISHITNIDLRTGIAGHLNLSAYTSLEWLDCSGSPALTAITLPTLTGGNITTNNIALYSTDLYDLDISPITDWGGSISVYSCPNLSAITFPASGYLKRIDLNDTAVRRLDFSGLTGAIGIIGADSCSSLTGITIPAGFPSPGGTLGWDFTNCDITGHLDMSAMSGFSSNTTSGFELTNNSNLTGITFGPSDGTIGLMTLQGTSVSGHLDLSPINVIWSIYANNLAISAITLSKSSNFQDLNLGQSSDLTSIDMSSSQPWNWCSFLNSPSLTSITFGNSSFYSAFTPSQGIQGQNCTGLTSIDMSPYNAINNIVIHTNPSLTGLTAGTSTRAHGLYASNCDLQEVSIENSSYITILELYGNSNLTEITLPAASGNVSSILIYNTGIGYFDTAVMSGKSQSSITINNNNSNMTTANVNHVLVDLDNNGWSGGTVILNNNSAPPDGSSGGFDGLTASGNLVTKSWTVTVD